MSVAIIALVALVCLPALWIGGRKVATWDEDRDPDQLSALVHQGVTNLLKFSLMLLMLSTGAAGVIGSILAMRDGTTPVRGIVVCAACAVVVGLGTIYAYWFKPLRNRRKTGTRSEL